MRILSVILALLSVLASPLQARTVVATTSMLADAARQLLPADSRVAALMGPGVDPHSYQPTRRDIQRLASADLVLINGVHLEGRMDAAFERLREGGRRLWVAAEALDSEQLICL